LDGVKWSGEPLRSKLLCRLCLDQACLEGSAKIHIQPVKCTSVVEKIIAAQAAKMPACGLLGGIPGQLQAVEFFPSWRQSSAVLWETEPVGLPA